jgi:hypothetical protein
MQVPNEQATSSRVKVSASHWWWRNANRIAMRGRKAPCSLPDDPVHRKWERCAPHLPRDGTGNDGKSSETSGTRIPDQMPFLRIAARRRPD